MSINLATKYSDKIAQKHTHESFLAGKAKAPYDFIGVKSIRIYTLLSQPLNDYDRANTSNRYGALAELQDSYQEISLTQDKSFRIAIDKGNNNEQMMVKESGRVMKMQMREQVVPAGDKRALFQWAWGAGKCVEYSAAVSKSNIIGTLLDIEKQFADSFTPLEGRYVAVKNEHMKFIRLSDEFQYVDGVREKFILKGSRQGRHAEHHRHACGLVPDKRGARGVPEPRGRLPVQDPRCAHHHGFGSGERSGAAWPLQLRCIRGRRRVRRRDRVRNERQQVRNADGDKGRNHGACHHDELCEDLLHAGWQRPALQRKPRGVFRSNRKPGGWHGPQGRCNLSDGQQVHVRRADARLRVNDTTGRLRPPRLLEDI